MAPRGAARAGGGLAHHLHQSRVGEVADDVLEDVAIGDEAERSEEDDNGDGVADVRHRRLNAGASHPLDLRRGVTEV